MDSATKDAQASAYATEAFTLLGISILLTAVRTFHRARVVGIKGFQADDYFVLLGLVSPSFISALTGSSRAAVNPCPWI